MRRVNGLATAGTDLHFSILHSPGLLFIDHKNCSFTIKKLNMANYSLYCHIAKNLLYRKIFQTFWDAYIYIYIYIYIYVCVCVYVCMYVCMYECMYVCMYVCTHVCMNFWRWVLFEQIDIECHVQHNITHWSNTNQINSPNTFHNSLS